MVCGRVVRDADNGRCRRWGSDWFDNSDRYRRGRCRTSNSIIHRGRKRRRYPGNVRGSAAALPCCPPFSKAAATVAKYRTKRRPPTLASPNKAFPPTVSRFAALILSKTLRPVAWQNWVARPRAVQFSKAFGDCSAGAVQPGKGEKLGREGLVAG